MGNYYVELDEGLHHYWCFKCRSLGPSYWKYPKSRFVLASQKSKFSIKNFFINSFMTEAPIL